MKKILTLLLFVVVAASLCFLGCGGPDDPDPGPIDPAKQVAENAVCVNDDITEDTPLPKTATYRITFEKSVTDSAGVTEDNVLMINVTEIDPRTDYVSIPYWGESCYDKDYYIEKGYTHLNYRVYIENSENINVINAYYEDSDWAVVGETPSLITRDMIHDGWNDVSGWIDGFIDNYDYAQTHWMFALDYTGPFKIGFDSISAFKQENVGPTDVWAFQEADAREMSTEDVAVSYKKTFESQNDVMHFDFNKAGSFSLNTARWRMAHPGTYFTENNYKSAIINVYVSDASKVTALKFSESYSGLNYDLYVLADGLVDGWNEIVLDGTLGLFTDYNRFNRFGSLSFTTTDAVVVAIGDTTASKNAVAPVEPSNPGNPDDPSDPDDPVDPTPVTDELVYAFTADLLEGLANDADIEYEFKNTLTDSNDVSEHNVLCIKRKTSGDTKYIGINGLTAAHDKQYYIDQGYTHLKFRIYVSDPSKVGRITFYTSDGSGTVTGENGGLLFNDGDKSNVKAGWNDVYSPIDLYLDNFDFFQLANQFALNNTGVCEIGIASVTAVDLGYEDNVIWAFNEDSAEGMNSVKYTTRYESTYQGKDDVLVMNVGWGADGGYDIQPFAWRPVYSAKHYRDLGYTHIRVSLYVPENVTVTKVVFNQRLVSWVDQSETLDGLTLTEGWHDIDFSIDNFLADYTRFQCFTQFTIYCQEGAANGLAFGTITAVTK